MKKLLILFLFFTISTQAQQTIINVGGWNCYVHVPYNYNPALKYPTIIFTPGLGEVGTNASALISNGPGAYIAQGWNGNVKIGADSVRFIVISLQPPSAWPGYGSIDSRIQTLKTLYSIDPKQMHLTGLSMGGWASMQYVTGDNIGGPYYYANQVASVVSVEGVTSSDNSPWPDRFDNFSLNGGKMLNFEQLNDYRKGDIAVARMNAKVPGSATYIQTNFSGGGHCCWNEFYGGQGTQPGNLINGENIYQWMARQSKSVAPPVHKKILVPAGGDGGIYFLNNNNQVTAGDTILIQGGEYPYMTFMNLHGTAKDTIVIMNTSGQVVVNGNKGTTSCYNIKQSTYFRFTGTGDSRYFYGFKAKGTGTNAGSSTIGYQTSNYRADHFEAYNVENGWLSKINPESDDITTWRGGWTVKNVQYDNMLIHKTGGEGIYFMNSDMQTAVKVNGRDTLVQPVGADTVNFYSIITDSTGWDGIQVSSCLNIKIHGNTVTNYGLINMSSQQAGIILGGRSIGDVYNNLVRKGTGNGMQIAGYGIVKVYQNILDSCGFDGSNERQDALYIDDNPFPAKQYGGESVYIFNNTIINAGRGSIWMPNSFNSMGTGSKLYNNLLIAPHGQNNADHYIEGNIIFDGQNNVRVPTISGANLSGYKLSSASPGVSAGVNLSQYFTQDFNGVDWEGIYNAGAFKFKVGGPLPVIITKFYISE